MISVQVKTLDGKPMSDVVVVCIGPESPAVLNGSVLAGGGERFQTDAEGRFTLRLQKKNFFVVVANEKGFGLSANYDLKTDPTIVVKPWGRIEGVRTNCRQPVANRRLKCRLGWREIGSHDIVSSLTMPVKITTDSQGRFQFEHVPSMTIVISEARECPSEIWFSLPARAEVKPIETTFVELSTQGRTVSGRLDLHKDLPSDFDPKNCRGTLNLDPIRPQPPQPPQEADSLVKRTKWWQDWYATDAGKSWLESTIAGTIFGFDSDGSFAAELVEPERYYVACHFGRNGETVRLEDKASYVIPVSDTDTNAPFDIGKVTLKLRK